MLCSASIEYYNRAEHILCFFECYGIANGSSLGYVAWYKQFIETAKIEPLHPSADRQGVQRMVNVAGLLCFD